MGLTIHGDDEDWVPQFDIQKFNIAIKWLLPNSSPEHTWLKAGIMAMIHEKKFMSYVYAYIECSRRLVIQAYDIERNEDPHYRIQPRAWYYGRKSRLMHTRISNAFHANGPLALLFMLGLDVAQFQGLNVRDWKPFLEIYSEELASDITYYTRQIYTQTYVPDCEEL